MFHWIVDKLTNLVLYVNSQPKFVYVSTSANPSNSISTGKNSVLSDDLLQIIYDIMFNNSFVDQHWFDYSEPRR